MVKTDKTILCHKSALSQRVQLKATHTHTRTIHKYNTVYNIGTSQAHTYRLRQLQYISPICDGTTVTGVSHKCAW